MLSSVWHGEENMEVVICGLNPDLTESSRRTAIGISINKALIPPVVSLPNSGIRL